MDAVIRYILSLFASPEAAQAFLDGPEQAMTLAGVNAAPQEFALAAANALPGVDLGSDPIGGLQQVLTDQYGYAPASAGYEPDGGYGPGLVSTVADDGAALVGDAVAPVVYGADAVLDDGGAIAGGLGAGLVSAVDAGLWSAADGGFGGQEGAGFGWQPGWGGFGPGTGEFGQGFGPGWGGFGPGWGDFRPGGPEFRPGWSDFRPGWGDDVVALAFVVLDPLLPAERRQPETVDEDDRVGSGCAFGCHGVLLLWGQST